MNYIALLRGINVSGHNKLLMADLRQLFLNLGFEAVQTYIQRCRKFIAHPPEKGWDGVYSFKTK